MNHERCRAGRTDRHAGNWRRVADVGRLVVFAVACALGSAGALANDATPQAPSPTAASIQIIEIGPDGVRVTDLPVSPVAAESPDSAGSDEPAAAESAGPPAAEAAVVEAPAAEAPAAAAPTAEVPSAVPVASAADGADTDMAAPAGPENVAASGVEDTGRPDDTALPAGVDAGVIGGLAGGDEAPAVPGPVAATAPAPSSSQADDATDDHAASAPAATASEASGSEAEPAPEAVAAAPGSEVDAKPAAALPEVVAAPTVADAPDASQQMPAGSAEPATAKADATAPDDGVSPTPESEGTVAGAVAAPAASIPGSGVDPTLSAALSSLRGERTEPADVAAPDATPAVQAEPEPLEPLPAEQMQRVRDAFALPD